MSLLLGYFDERGNDFADQIRAMLDHLRVKDVATAKIPASSFPSRPNGNAQEPRVILAEATTVAFFNIGCFRPGTVNHLPGDTSPTHIFE